MNSQRLVDPYSKLTPTQAAVFSLLDSRPYDGICRRDAAQHDIFELSARIGEIEDRLGITVIRERCRVHSHRKPFKRYRI